MTPEERANQVCQDLGIRSVKVTTVPPEEFGQPFTKTREVAPIIADASRAARLEALEEAAKIADEAAATAHDEPAHYGANDACQATAENIASAIRERAK